MRKPKPAKPSAEHAIKEWSLKEHFANQGILAENVFKLTREDKSPDPNGSLLTPRPGQPQRHPLGNMSDEERRRLLHKLSLSCRKTAELFAQLIPVLPPARQGLQKPIGKKDPLSGLIFLLESAHAYWGESDQTIDGLEKGLELFAQYFETLRERPSGARGDRALTRLIEGKLVAWLAVNKGKSPCYYHAMDEEWRGPFLCEMETTLKRLGYTYASRNALGQRIKAARKRVMPEFIPD